MSIETGKVRSLGCQVWCLCRPGSRRVADRRVTGTPPMLPCRVLLLGKNLGSEEAAATCLNVDARRAGTTSAGAGRLRLTAFLGAAGPKGRHMHFARRGVAPSGNAVKSFSPGKHARLTRGRKARPSRLAPTWPLGHGLNENKLLTALPFRAPAMNSPPDRRLTRSRHRLMLCRPAGPETHLDNHHHFADEPVFGS